MHSPTGSPTEPSFTPRTTEKSEQHQKIEKTKSASKARFRSSQKSRLPPDLPPELVEQLITVTSPGDLLSAHTTSNNRRLRKLLCRYTNQIQYGCKNSYCTVPSCLTCRRRKSTTPIRKYTDVTARALAAHIIEELGEKGLCHNEPVVPWSESRGPSLRAHTGEAKLEAGCQAEEHATGQNPAQANGCAAEASSSLPTELVKSRQSSGFAKPENPATTSEGLAHKQAVTKSNEIYYTSAAESSPVPLLRRDTKSFTQAVFDSLSLRSLWSTSQPRTVNAQRSNILGLSQDAPQFQSKALQTYHQNGDSAKHCDLKPILGHSTSDKKVAMQETIVDTQEHVSRSGKKDDHTHMPNTVLCKHDPSHPSKHLNGTISQENKESEELPTTETTRTYEIEVSRGPSCAGIKMESQSHSLDRQVDSHGKGGRPQVQVAPFLSVTLLSLIMDWHNRIFYDSFMPWPERKLSEPYAEFTYNTILFCLRNPARILRSIYDWHQQHGKIAVYNGNKFEGPVLRCGILIIAYIVPLGECFRTLRLGLADAYHLPPSLQGTAMNRRKRNQRKALDESSSDDSVDHHGHERHISNEDTARLCAFGLLLLQEAVLALMAAKSTKTRTVGLKVAVQLDLCNNFSEVLIENYLTILKEADLLTAGSVSSGQNYRVLGNHAADLIDYFDDYDAQQLFARITDLIAARYVFGEMLKSRRGASVGNKSTKDKPSVASLVANHLAHCAVRTRGLNSEWHAVLSTVQWTRVLFARDWDGNAVIRKTSSLGGSLQLLKALFASSRQYDFPATQFHIPVLAARLNMVEMPVEWLSFRPDNKNVHLLTFPFLFEPHVLVSCFRAINYSKMNKAAIEARALQKDVRDLTDSIRHPGTQSGPSLQNSLNRYLANTFVITVRRDNLLEDAIDQIWRRQRRELLRPLKVRMGMDEGEQGIDIGGVQQEFFRILFAHALNPEYAMFNIDERTRMAWFRPGSLEPLYKFEVLGVLLSLAVYNSITVPITFPLAFYRKLLGLKVKKVHDIADGWPELARGLQQMLEWSDGDVSDVYVRTYEFSYEAFGRPIFVNMKKFDKDTPWPPKERKKGKEKAKTASFELPPEYGSEQPSNLGNSGTVSPLLTSQEYADDEAPTVTNADREDYVKDYITWLTNRSVEQQYKAFAKGFYTCVDQTALSIFTPEALKAVIEGYTDIDLAGLEAVTKYEDGFNESSPTIQDFWQVVRSFSTEQHRRLLEFVTASDRVPVNGIQSIQFILQRNGTGDERLPTSMTCFGRLLLPQYSSRQVLEEKLTKAIENSEGFGVA